MSTIYVLKTEEEYRQLLATQSATIAAKDEELARVKRERDELDRILKQWTDIKTERDTIRAQLTAAEAEKGELRALLNKKREESVANDSIVASCNCLTKTPEVKYHKPGCKYRLIMERDSLRASLESVTKERDEARKDTERLAEIESNCWDLRCIDVPTGGGDADVQWLVIEHRMGKPSEVEVGSGPTPRTAIDSASTPPAP